MFREIKTHDGFLAEMKSRQILNEQQVARVQQAKTSLSQPLDSVLMQLGFIEENVLLEHYSDYFQIGLLGDDQQACQSRVSAVGLEYLKANAVVLLDCASEGAKLAVADPFDALVSDTLEYFLGEDLEKVIASRSKVDELLREASQNLQSSATDADFLLDEEISQLDMERLQDIAREAPVIQLVNKMITDALKHGATDIHLEPEETHIDARFRVNGVLEHYDRFQKSMQAGVSTRIKILSGMNISERRRPQDGRMRLSISGKEVDFRTSSVPSIHGETIVIRVLERSSDLLELANLGFDKQAQEVLGRITSVANGMVLVTGPTGSGKTTTLYSILTALNDGKSKIFTVEDPVEYRLKGITQMQVDAEIGLDFASTLRSVLRQDPDTILIGEIRDLETARIAVQAALTGHRVLATLHTNSAIGAITRLRDMGVDSYLLAATLRGILGQRLLRKLCSECLTEKFGNQKDSYCNHCNNTRYDGRQVIYEIFESDASVARMMGDGSGEDEIFAYACSTGMVSIAKHAQMLVEQKVTTLEEVRRVTDLDFEHA